MNVLFCGKSSLGPRYLMSLLKYNGHKAFGIFPSINEELMNKFKPSLIGFSATTADLDGYLEDARLVKSISPEARVIFGGVHPTLAPDEVIQSDHVDFICRGEGEFPMLELCNALDNGDDLTSIQNIWAKIGNKIYKNEMRPLEQEIDQFEMDREDFEYHGTFATRGCIGECTFCSSPMLKKISSGGYVRTRSVDNVIEELKKIYRVQQWPSHYRKNEWMLLGRKFSFGGKNILLPFRFKDDNFALNRSWLAEFVDKFQKFFPGKKFLCQLRADYINEETVRLLKKGGCVCVSIGIESGSERVRNEILGKGVSNEQLISAGELLKRYDIQLMGQWIIGSPGETVEDLMDSLKLHSILGDIAQVHIATPYPFTKMYDYAIQNGYLKPGEKIASGLYDNFYFHSGDESQLFKLVYEIFPIANEVVNTKRSIQKVLGNASFAVEDRRIVDIVLDGHRNMKIL